MSARAGVSPATENNARPATTRASTGLSHAQMSRLVSTIVDMSATAGPPLRRTEVRDAITAHVSQGRTPSEILHRARNAYGIVDPTGETAARNVDSATKSRRSTGCICGCSSAAGDECVTRRPVPDRDGHCCATFSVDQLAKGMGCARHNLNPLYADVVA